MAPAAGAKSRPLGGRGGRRRIGWRRSPSEAAPGPDWPPRERRRRRRRAWLGQRQQRGPRVAGCLPSRALRGRSREAPPPPPTHHVKGPPGQRRSRLLGSPGGQDAEPADERQQQEPGARVQLHRPPARRQRVLLHHPGGRGAGRGARPCRRGRAGGAPTRARGKGSCGRPLAGTLSPGVLGGGPAARERDGAGSQRRTRRERCAALPGGQEGWRGSSAVCHGPGGGGGECLDRLRRGWAPGSASPARRCGPERTLVPLPVSLKARCSLGTPGWP